MSRRFEAVVEVIRAEVLKRGDVGLGAASVDAVISSFASALAQKLESVAPVDSAAVRADAAATDGLLLATGCAVRWSKPPPSAPAKAQEGDQHSDDAEHLVTASAGTGSIERHGLSVSHRVLGSSSAPRSR